VAVDLQLIDDLDLVDADYAPQSPQTLRPRSPSRKSSRAYTSPGSRTSIAEDDRA
jgi:hypothetical protein